MKEYYKELGVTLALALLLILPASGNMGGGQSSAISRARLFRAPVEDAPVLIKPEVNLPVLEENKVIPKEEVVIDGITFNITRSLENNFIIKKISFFDNGKDYAYFEKVKKLELNDIQQYLDKAGLKTLHLFGDYDLKAFDMDTSKRLILICKK